jgi:hypothetical protein
MKWKEIQRNLPSGQSVYSRPDITVPVFAAKSESLLKDILGKRAIFGKVKAYVISTEHQKRGGLHYHMLLTLEHHDRLNDPSWWDEIMSAEIPDLPAEIKTPAEVQQHRLWYNVVHNQLHDQ